MAFAAGAGAAGAAVAVLKWRMSCLSRSLLLLLPLPLQPLVFLLFLQAARDQLQGCQVLGALVSHAMEHERDALVDALPSFACPCATLKPTVAHAWVVLENGITEDAVVSVLEQTMNIVL